MLDISKFHIARGFLCFVCGELRVNIQYEEVLHTCFYLWYAVSDNSGDFYEEF